jgi:hypothetical protein
MKKILFVFILLTAISETVFAQIETKKIEINGKEFLGCQKFPVEICGEYLFNKKGDPRVLLNFQRHGVVPHAINFWIHCDEQGTPIKTYGFDGNHFVTVFFQYVDEEVRSQWGEFISMEIKVAYDKGYSIIHQERFYLFRK